MERCGEGDVAEREFGFLRQMKQSLPYGDEILIMEKIPVARE